VRQGLDAVTVAHEGLRMRHARSQAVRSDVLGANM
jgi:hypothetical protein